MTVAELGERMSSRELSEWMAFYHLEPFGPEAADTMNAINTAATVNAVRGSVGIKKSADVESFLIGKPFGEPDEPENPLMAKFMSLTNHLGTADGDDREPEHHAEPEGPDV